MDLAEHFAVMWRQRWRIVAAALIVAGLVYFARSSVPAVYEARVVLAVSPGRLATGQARDPEEALFLARTYAELATTRPVVSDAVQRAGLRIDADRASDQVSVDVSEEVSFLSVTATGASPDAARRLAQGLSDALVAALERQQADDVQAAIAPLRARATTLENELDALGPDAPGRSTIQARYQAVLEQIAAHELRAGDRLAVISPARAASAPVSPKPTRDAVFAFIAALVVNAELAVLLRGAGDRLPQKRLVEEVPRLTGLPLLADLPRADGRDAVEPFRSLRTTLMVMPQFAGVRSIAVVSAAPHAGRTYCAVNLARSFASIDVAVVLVDADLREPELHGHVGIPLSPGLRDVLQGKDVMSCLADAPALAFLRVLPAGSPPRDPAGLLAARLTTNVLEALPPALVILDTPPVDHFVDAIAVARQCDLTILLVDRKRARRSTLRAMVERLREVGAEPAGIVLNRSRSGRSSPPAVASSDETGKDAGS